jgi:hypothetical protein
MASKTPDEIVRDSGNTFHCKVATLFRNAGWSVMLSPYYVDSATDKAREFDLLCERECKWVDPFQQRHVLWLQLFVECKYIAQPIVFWFDGLDVAQATKWLESNTPFKSQNIYQKEHHYLRGVETVAKLFASGGARQDDNDPFYKALTQCLGGLTQSASWNTHEPSSLARARQGAQSVTILRYPVIVHSGSGYFYSARVAASDDPTVPLRTNFLFEANYAYLNSNRSRSEQGYFLVDVVDVALLNDFLSTLDHDVNSAKVLLSNN